MAEGRGHLQPVATASKEAVDIGEVEQCHVGPHGLRQLRMRATNHGHHFSQGEATPNPKLEASGCAPCPTHVPAQFDLAGSRARRSGSHALFQLHRNARRLDWTLSEPINVAKLSLN